MIEISWNAALLFEQWNSETKLLIVILSITNENRRISIFFKSRLLTKEDRV